ncbi:elongation factor 1-delta-like isoform X2 [Acanthaster planci]|uniref:Elongation factor 1-delta-like isoform X2 n=1 Tax=Acanthaster planci TaxID=133434 RepID=A0A8B7ZKA8_ACAPL|nr:elongation factor 1-delta-like isoform X2 [Acanthaster planci]
MAHPMMMEGVWFEKYRVDDAEKAYQEHRAKELSGLVVEGVGLGIGVTVDNPDLAARLAAVEKENADLRRVTADLQAAVSKLTERVNALDMKSPAAPAAAPVKKQETPVQDEEDDDDDDDIDLFGDDDEDEGDALAQIQAKRAAEEKEKTKSKKQVIAKSSIILDVKPWDDETDMHEIEKLVRTIQADGLLWGASKLVPLAYGIKKLQIGCVVEDDKIGTDFLEEEITKFEDMVQSVDVAAFNKI